MKENGKGQSALSVRLAHSFRQLHSILHSKTQPTHIAATACIEERTNCWQHNVMTVRALTEQHWHAITEVTEETHGYHSAAVCFPEQLLRPVITTVLHACECCGLVSYIYRVSRGECARLRENVPYIKVHRSYPKHLYPKLNGYGDNGERKVWSSCVSTYCTCFAYYYSCTAHVRPSVSQPSQAHPAFLINRCHSYSELQFNTAGYSCAM